MISSNEILIESMIWTGAIKTPRIINAFKNIDRKYFVPQDLTEYIYNDAPLPIGKDQTISQPTTVAIMLELLEAEEGDSVLDIGSGSGWTTSLLGLIVGEHGRVTGLERINELVDLGRKNLKQFGFNHADIVRSEEELGLPEKTFDAILVSASASEIPYKLLDQLNIGGRLVIPVRNSIFRFKKLSSTEIKKEEYPGFIFVPLVVGEGNG